jgi:hypothetical protein
MGSRQFEFLGTTRSGAAVFKRITSDPFLEPYVARPATDEELRELVADVLSEQGRTCGEEQS